MTNPKRFSNRTNWQREQNRLSLLVEEMRKGGGGLLDLTVSNPTDVGFSYPQSIPESLANPALLRYQPHPRGLISARKEIAGYYKSKGIGVDPEAILLTSGSSESYAFIFRLLCEEGDSILVPVPSYPLLDHLAQINDVSIRNYGLNYDGEWHIDFASLELQVDERVKAILVINPNNPTGSFLKADEFARLRGICASNNIALVVDEVFADFGFGNDQRRILSAVGESDAFTFTLNGLSKMSGLPQMKLGWMIVNGKKEIADEALSRLEIMADAFLSVNTPVQVALHALLQAGEGIRNQIRQRTQTNLGALRSLIGRDARCTVLNVEGGWSVVLQVPGTRSDEEWAIRLLQRCAVIVQPGYLFDFSGAQYLVLSLLTEEKVFRHGVEMMVKEFEE